MKCPACGFDSPDGAGWCDFCKEPFRKRTPKPEPGPAPAAPRVNGAGTELAFEHLDAGERIPVVPRWARLCAWAFLFLWFVWGLLLLGYYAARRAMKGGGAPLSGGRP